MGTKRMAGDLDRLRYTPWTPSLGPNCISLSWGFPFWTREEKGQLGGSPGSSSASFCFQGHLSLANTWFSVLSVANLGWPFSQPSGLPVAPCRPGWMKWLPFSHQCHSPPRISVACLNPSAHIWSGFPKKKCFPEAHLHPDGQSE